MEKLKKLSKLFEEGLEFLRNIEKKDKTVLIYDSDVDGLCSAALVLIVLQKMKKKIWKIVPSWVDKIKKFTSVVKKADKIITLDVPTELIEKYLIKTKRKMLIIDHHPGRNLNSKDVVYINPRIENPEIYQPTSYVVYKMFLNFLKEKKWVGVLGTVGDYGTRDCKDLIKIKDEKNIWDSKYGKVAVLMTSAIVFLGPEKTLKILIASKELKDFEKNKRIILAGEMFDEELERCENEFRENLEIWGKVLISEIKPRYRKIGSSLITSMSSENPEKIIVLFEKMDNRYSVHGRNRTGEVHMGELFKRIFNGGGHRQAAGGIIKKRDKEEIKKRLICELKDFTS